MMIDVSRHFEPLDELYREVDIMSHYGLNTLHLHLTDAAGWRMEIKAYPRLTEVGAWRTRQTWKEWWNKPEKRATARRCAPRIPKWRSTTPR